MLQNVDFFKTLLNGIKSKFQSQQKQISKHNTRLDDQQAQIEDLKNKKIDAVLYTPQTLTEGQQKQARDNIGAVTPSSFIVNITGSEYSGWKADKTFQEIDAAVASGIMPVCKIPKHVTDSYGYGVAYYAYKLEPPFGDSVFYFRSLDTSKTYTNYTVVGISSSNNVDVRRTTMGMVGATETKPGDSGYVPSPKSGDNTKFLRGDATWADVPKYELQWEVIADIITTSEDVLYYRYDVPDKKELIVLVSLTPLADSTSPVNGTIAINGTGNPWKGNYTHISGNILSVKSSERGGSVVLSGEIIDRKWVPKSLFSSLNRGASWNALRPDGTMPLTSDDTTNACSFTSVDAIRSVAVGSYTKWFGVGSHIYILAR